MKIFLVLAFTVTLSAHDMWIEPATFFPEKGEIVPIKLRLGQDLLGDPLARSSSLINQFVVEDSAGRKPVIGHEGANPAGIMRVAVPGVSVVGYYSNPSSVEETADVFNRYLKEEGLETIAMLRARRNETNNKVNEQFSRCAKSLLLTDSAGTSGDRILGFPLELVAERNPYTTRPSEDLPVRLTYMNKPLEGVLVVAMNKQNPMEKISARTGADGKVKLRLQRPSGMWLIKAVHMVPAPSGSNADWSSYWASLTFERPSAGVPK